jgi:hypothetical protein
MDLGKIDEPHIRDCTSYIGTTVQDPREQRALHLAFHLIRLSLEHTTIMKNQRCNKFFEHDGYTRGLVDVADLRSQGIEEPLSYRASLAAIIEAFDTILSARGPKTIEDTVKIHESMRKYREHIWHLASSKGTDAIAIQNELERRATEYGFFRRLLGGSWKRKAEAAVGLALTGVWPVEVINLALQGSLADLLSNLASSSGLQSEIGVVLAVLSVSHVRHDRAVEMNADPALWPVALAVHGDKISHSDIRETIRLIEQVVGR